MRAGSELRELDAAGFRAELDVLLSIYASAMKASPLLLPGRRSIMERHAQHASFHGVAVLTAPPDERIVAFTYGFHGARGQWWHDLVHGALAGERGREAAREWMGDSFEVAEVHVHPDHQRQGIGRRMLARLLSGRPERTALLSTMDAESSARRLYRRLGFTDLLTAFRFAGTEPPYAVMGATLPLMAQPPPGTVPLARPAAPPPPEAPTSRGPAGS